MSLSTSVSLFARYAHLLACPLCGASVSVSGGSLKCPQGHTYDISARGTAHMAPWLRGADDTYDRALFEARARVLDGGLYEDVLTAVRALAGLKPGHAFLDAGCGEGFYAARLMADVPGGFGIALDAAADGVRMAARRASGALCLLGDLTRMPVKTGLLDAVVNILSPANYAEFARVLRPGGLIVKAVPGRDYLRELRALTPGVRDEYEEGAVEAHLSRHARVMARREVHVACPLTPELASALSLMTPLTRRARFSTCDIDRVTIHMHVLAAMPMSGGAFDAL